MKSLVLIVAVISTLVAGGCAETSDGRPGADTSSTSKPTSSSTSSSTSTSTSTTEPAPPEFPTMGVTPTLRDAVPPNALVCLPAPTPGTPATALIGDAAAPRIVIAMPDGWTAAPSPQGLALTGPDGMSGTVEISQTDLDAAAAFEKYADDVAAEAPISSISVLPAENCGYSGQRLMGMLSGGPAGKLSYEDRIAHIWTNTKDYLVVIHVAAPQGSPAFDAATLAMTADFAITLP
jgi:hypothetical protein